MDLKPTASSDAERFRQWQLAALNARPHRTELKSVGPFSVMVPDSAGLEPWVTLVQPEIAESEVRDSLPLLRSMFARRESGWQIEYNEAVLPAVEPWLVSAGFELRERNPLMACRPEAFRPHAAAEITLIRLQRDSPASQLEAFQRIRWTDGGEHDRAVPSEEQLRQELAVATSVYLLAAVGGEPAGTGVSHPLAGAAEIVGVVTRLERRRRGVAATVTSELTALHFATGGDFVFLDASGEPAARVYERLGFTRFGANLVFAQPPAI